MCLKKSILLLCSVSILSCSDDGKEYDIASFAPVPLDSVQVAPQPASRNFTISPPSIDGKSCKEYTMSIQLYVKQDSVRSYTLTTSCGNPIAKKEYKIEPGDTKEKIAKRVSTDLGITIPPSSISNKLPLKRGEKITFQ